MPQDATGSEAVGRSVLGGAACGLSFAGACGDALAQAVRREGARHDAAGGRAAPAPRRPSAVAVVAPRPASAGAGEAPAVSPPSAARGAVMERRAAGRR